jgi:hypothetical protein
MPSALTKTAWAKICDAAGRRPKAEAEARAMLSAVLFEEYPACAHDREGAARDRERSERMVEHLDAFAELYRQWRLPHLSVDEFQARITRRAFPVVANKRENPALYRIGMVRLLAESPGDAAWSKQIANIKNADSQREWLVHRLCEVWLDHFQGPPPEGQPERLPPPGRARTPLVNFILAAMREIRPQLTLPRPDTVRDIIKRVTPPRKQLGSWPPENAC